MNTAKRNGEGAVKLRLLGFEVVCAPPDPENQEKLEAMLEDLRAGRETQIDSLPAASMPMALPVLEDEEGRTFLLDPESGLVPWEVEPTGDAAPGGMSGFVGIDRIVGPAEEREARAEEAAATFGVLRGLAESVSPGGSGGGGVLALAGDLARTLGGGVSGTLLTGIASGELSAGDLPGALLGFCSGPIHSPADFPPDTRGAELAKDLTGLAAGTLRDIIAGAVDDEDGVAAHLAKAASEPAIDILESEVAGILAASLGPASAPSGSLVSRVKRKILGPTATADKPMLRQTDKDEKGYKVLAGSPNCIVECLSAARIEDPVEAAGKKVYLGSPGVLINGRFAAGAGLSLSEAGAFKKGGAPGAAQTFIADPAAGAPPPASTAGAAGGEGGAGADGGAGAGADGGAGTEGGAGAGESGAAGTGGGDAGAGEFEESAGDSSTMDPKRVEEMTGLGPEDLKDPAKVDAALKQTMEERLQIQDDLQALEKILDDPTASDAVKERAKELHALGESKLEERFDLHDALAPHGSTDVEAPHPGIDPETQKEIDRLNHEGKQLQAICNLGRLAEGGPAAELACQMSHEQRMKAAALAGNEEAVRKQIDARKKAEAWTGIVMDVGSKVPNKVVGGVIATLTAPFQDAFGSLAEEFPELFEEVPMPPDVGPLSDMLDGPSVPGRLPGPIPMPE